MRWHQRNLLGTQDLTVEEIETLLDVAEQMRRDRHSPEHRTILAGRTFFTMFFASSLRTRLSFAAAAAELGGQAVEVFPDAARLGSQGGWREATEDVARVIASYGAGVGIRTSDARSSGFGEGAAFLREYAESSEVPVVCMGDDSFHPCQGLADLAGLRTFLGPDLKGKRILITWARGVLARSRSSTQETLLASSRMGMDVTLAHPPGYELDPEVISKVEENCASAGSAFRITHDAEGSYAGQHVVYSRNWVSTEAFSGGRFRGDDEVARAMDEHRANWVCNADKMRLTEDAFFLNPMPLDRGREATDEIASGPRSMIYHVAENRLHVQKAFMALAMTQEFATEHGL